MGEALGQIFYRRPQALTRDVDSISSIMRLRRGREFFVVEDCRALFVTSNTALARISRHFFYEDAAPNAIAPCLTDDALTNLLWLKSPTKAPDLPRKRIIADCYAATQPDEALWRKYVAEIDRLAGEELISVEDCLLLRHSLEAKRVLMDLTMGDEVVFAQGTVKEILEMVEAQHQAELRAKLETEVQRRETAEKATERHRLREEERRANLHKRSMLLARRVTLGVERTVLVALLVGTAWTFPWDLPNPAHSPLRYVLPLIWAALLILSVAGVIYGATVRSALRRLEGPFARWIEQRFAAMFEG